MDENDNILNAGIGVHDTPAYAAPTQAPARTLFGHVRWLVAATADCFALGCYAGRDLSGGWSIVWFLAGFGCLIALNFGLVIFAGLTMYDFQRLRRSRGMASAPVIAASIFLDALNVFLFFLRIFGGRDLSVLPRHLHPA